MIEIYIRHSNNKAMLNLYVPKEMKDRFLTGIENGNMELPDDSAHFELSILPEWVTAPDQREMIEKLGLHVRVPIAAINTQFTD